MAALPSARNFSGSILIRGTRLVPVMSPVVTDRPVDIRISGGVVEQVDTGLHRHTGELDVDAGGRWAIPGLWDQHVHLAQWSQTQMRLDVSGTSSPGQVTSLVRAHVSRLAADPGSAVVIGAGYRSATWSLQPTVAELDAVSEDHPVILISGDGHNGWLNSHALRLFGVADRSEPLNENEWFAVFARIADLPGLRDGLEDAYRQAVQAAATKGVVGLVDMEFGRGYRDWQDRFARGIDQVRVRPATYPDRLEEVIEAGLRSGHELFGGGLLTMGPLKIISDGSLNTRTASCCEPYADASSLEFPRGKQNHSLAELTALLARAKQCGFEIAVHAIGDAAVATALDAIADTGASGSIEHAQLVRTQDIARMGKLGVRASVQPAHLLDDREVTTKCWPDRGDRCFPLQSMARAGAVLAMGSDAPVSRLDPWLAMASAVHRSADAQEPWNPAESLTAEQALAASTDGQPTIAPGNRGDIVLLDADPFQAVGASMTMAKHLREMRVAATFVAGRPTHLAL